MQLAELLASTKDKSGADILWREEEGEVAASLMSNLLEHADTLGEIKQGQTIYFVLGALARQCPDELRNYEAINLPFGQLGDVQIADAITPAYARLDAAVEVERMKENIYTRK